MWISVSNLEWKRLSIITQLEFIIPSLPLERFIFFQYLKMDENILSHYKYSRKTRYLMHTVINISRPGSLMVQTREMCLNASIFWKVMWFSDFLSYSYKPNLVANNFWWLSCTYMQKQSHKPWNLKQVKDMASVSSPNIKEEFPLTSLAVVTYILA